MACTDTRINPETPWTGDVSSTFAVCSPTEWPERTLKDGRIIYAHTDLGFFKRNVGIAGVRFREITSDRREARQFDTRALAKRALTYRSDRVMRIGVPVCAKATA